MLFLMSFAVAIAVASPKVMDVRIHRSAKTLSTIRENDEVVHVRWPFCPSYPSRVCTERYWVEMNISLDGYIQHRNAPHDSFQEIIASSVLDVRPIARALNTFYSKNSMTSLAERIGVVQGMIQSIHYAYDDCDGVDDPECQQENSTGWTEYPKYAIEFLLDQKGDCDDATVASVALLEALDIESWLVLWNGHISTAVTRAQGDLEAVQPPSGSRLVTPPDGSASLLHVDSVGILKGCTWTCLSLGWNEWFKDGLYVKKVLRYNDPEVDSLGLQARSLDGQRYRDVQREDRRKDKREQILKDIEERKEKWNEDNTKRLEDLGEEPEQTKKIIKKANPYKTNANEGWAVLLVLCFGGLALIGYHSIRQWRRRKEAALLAQKQREEDGF